jgi:hypothetical protein
MRTSNPNILRALFVTAGMALVVNILNAQVQIGTDIDGISVSEFFGNAVSMPDANTVAIGAPLHDQNNGHAGHVRVYTFNGTGWVQKGGDINGSDPGGFFGFALSMPDANTVAIGAHKNSSAGVDAGQTRIFEWNGSGWVQKGAPINGEALSDYSGWAVSMPDANTVSIGAYGNSGAAGRTRIFRWNGSSWVQKGSSIDGTSSNSRVGYAVSMPDSNTIAVGANYHGDVLQGQVRIHTWNGSSWEQKGTDLDGQANYDHFGSAVSMPDPNTVAIGAPFNNSNFNNAGQTRIYAWNGSSWEQKGADLNGEGTEDYSGNAVSMPDANTVAIGAYLNSGNGLWAGHVRIYNWTGSGWVQQGPDIDGEAMLDQSGTSLSMPDANTVAIGAPFNTNNVEDAGHVRVYSVCSTTINSINATSCGSYTSPSGSYAWTASGTYTDTIPNAVGCDSVITVNLTVNTVDVSLTNNSPTLTANAVGAIYQWLDCTNGYAVIDGATDQDLTVPSNGSYAVQVTQNACTDTSACEAVINVGLIQVGNGNPFTVYPIPTSGELTVDLGSTHDVVTVVAKNELGQEVFKRSVTASRLLRFNIPGDAGVYFVELWSADNRTTLKVVKE